MKTGTRQIHKGLRWMALAVTLLASGLFAACGGGGGGGGGPATTSGVSVGQMASGSIIVNGIRFDDSGATIEIENDATPSRGELRDGMIVEVTGTFNSDGKTGTATRVRFEDNLEGPVTGLTISATEQVKTFTVLGQPVRAELGVTLFDNNPGAVTFATLANDQVLEISGLPDANGVLQATFIEKEADTTAAFVAAGGVFEVKGIITSVNGTTSFTIGGLTVDRTTAVMNGTPTIGEFAEVKGTSFDGTTLIATSVEVGPDDLPDAAKVEVEGFISAFSSSPKTFMINGQLIDYSNAQFLGGIEADLVNGLKVEAEGPIVGGILAAVKIKFKESLRFEANVTTVDLALGTLQLQGFPNLVVQTDAMLTQIKENLALGDFSNTAVKLRGRLSGNTILVTRLEMVNTTPLSRTSVQGPVASFSLAGNTVTLFGQVVVSTSNINDVTHPSGSDFEIEDAEVSRATFFANLNNGDLVKARADNGAGNDLSWNQIEIELEDD